MPLGKACGKKKVIFFYAKAAFELDPDSSKEALMEYLISYPNGFYTEQARTMYRTFAL
jgi:hypothetical protein